MRKVIFEDINDGCTQVDQAIDLIHDKILEVAEIILKKEKNEGIDIDAD